MKSKDIKKLIRYSGCFLFYSALIWGQGDMGRMMTKASPEAGATANNNSSVDLYRGKMNSSIPIYKYKGREMDLPISLNYTASGIKVDQVASNVGLGWDLNVGGRLTRVVNGYADDTYGSNPCTNCVVEGTCDSYYMPRKDYYKINAVGYEDVFHFTTFVALSSVMKPYSELEVNSAGYDRGWKDGNWKYTAEDNSVFYFGQNNTYELATTQTTNTGCNSGTLTSATAWMLTKIVSKNHLDEYTFTYQNFEWATTIPNNGEGYVEIGGTPFYHTYGSNYKVTQQMLTAIYHNGMKIISFDYANRDDLTFVGGAGNALSRIHFYNFNSLEPYRTVDFTYSYFGNTSSGDELAMRLKLDQLTFYGVDSNGVRTAGDNYKLEYNSPDQVPRIDSYARDYLGLYNGKDTNTDLIENLILPNTALKLTPSESKRAYSYANSIIGTLKKITYPTKGSTEFEYEQNALKGGFGATFALTGNSQHAASIVNAEMCGSLPTEVTAIHPLMQTLNFSSFYGCPSNQVGKTFHAINAKSIYVHLNSPSYIKTGGIGLYLIQKTTPSNNTPITYPYCEYATINSNQYYLDPPTSFRLDMHPTNSIYYTSTNTYSNPQDFVSGGLTTATSIQTGFSTLPAGDYQITVWKFEESGSDYPYVYTLNNNIYEIYDNSTTSFQLVDHNTTSSLIDGFRIKSITYYDTNNHFVGKKGYRYNFDGNLYSNCLKNNYSTNVNGYIRNFLSSKAYANENEIIHYNTVYEVSLDSNDQNIGYVANSFGMTTSDEVFPSTTDPTVYFYYNLSKIDFITEKKVYSATGKLLHEENYSIDSQNYNSEMETEYTMPYYYMAKKESIDYVDPIQNKKITNKVDYDYQYNQLWNKTTNNTIIENYEYNPDYWFDFANPPVTDIKSNFKGDIKYIYAAYPPYANNVPSSAVTRYFVSEVQQAATTGGALETKVKFDYDDDGNQIETIQLSPGVIEDNRYESVLWGYNNRFPVAKLTGVRYSQIDAHKIDVIKNVSHLPVTPATTAQLQDILNTLRGDFPKALITTYTYNPVYGVTSVTDAKGYTVSTDYDVFGRVTFTKEKDEQGNCRILSENQYNTRPN